MNINSSNVGFNGRYLLRGKIDQVDRAASTIKSVEGDNVEFLPITHKDSKIVIVATKEDAQILKNKKTEKDFGEKIKAIYFEKKDVLKKLFEYIFSTTSDALIIQDENLIKFALTNRIINFDNGSFKHKHKIEEKFVDGTIKKYTIKGRMYESIHPDGKKIEWYVDGSKKITYPDNTSEIIPAKPVWTPEMNVFQTMENIPPQKIEELNEIEHLRSELASFNNKTKEQIKSDRDIFDNKGRLSKQTLKDGTTANYYYKWHYREPLFIYYSDGRFESQNGIVNKSNQTISFPLENGAKEIYNKFGIMTSIIFPDGTRKNFDENENITEKIYPNGKIELFTPEGRMYCIIHPDGTKEYLRRHRTSVFEEK